MGMDLLSAHGNLYLNHFSWHDCLECAYEFGWRPEGTIAPIDSHDKWDGSDYFSNAFQSVTDDDARNLGEALLRGVAAISALEQDKIQERYALKQAKLQERFFFVKFTSVDPAQALAVEVQRLQRFAAYALKGGFVIA